MKMGPLTVLIHKLHRKGIKGTLLASYYKLMVRALGSFPGKTLSSLGLETLAAGVTDRNRSYPNAYVFNRSRFHFSSE
jgi:hypothetical protein